MSAFGRLAIVGVGLIGGSIALAAKARGLATETVGVGRSASRLEAAVAAGVLDRGETDLLCGVADADLVVLCTPVEKIVADLPAVGARCRPDAVLTDAGSVKASIAAAGAHLSRFVPSHPMAGSERAGFEAAQPDLFVGATWVVTPHAGIDPDARTRVRAFAEALGARVVAMDPAAHDRAVAVTSHLPHLLAYALYAVARERSTDEPNLFDLAAGGFHSTTRVAASSPDLWTGICLDNRDAILAAARELRGELDRALAALEAGDADALLDCLRRGHRPL